MLFITTGGTIDKKPVYLADGKTFDNDSREFGETYLPTMLEKAGFTVPHTISSLFKIDSLEMTDEHRAMLSTTIEGADDTEIVVTHGTDTMPETARFLDKNKKLANKTIVLTGAMIPFSVGDDSDAMFNLGNAIAYAKALPSGIYVAMNGQAFEADNVRKNVQAGLFEHIR